MVKYANFRPTVGHQFSEFINQKLRTCEVLKVTKTRMRIVYEMPKGRGTIAGRGKVEYHGEMEAWRPLNPDGTYSAPVTDNRGNS